jgi:hypothetical protein
MLATCCAGLAALAGCATAGAGSAEEDDAGGAPPPPPVDASGPGQHDAPTSGLDAAPPPPAVDAGIDAAVACVEMDAGCTTPYVGACFQGTYQCDDAGVQQCVPNTTTQPCYDGPAGTKNVGACKGGTQTCVGSLGPCMGEVTPAAHENCFNGLDNDCNGVVGNGCPVSISIGGDRPLGGAGGGGGGASTLHCPPGAFVTRVDSWFDDPDQHASGVSIYCATPTLVKGASSYSVTLAANAPAPYATVTGGNSPTVERTDDCGIAGLTAISYETGRYDTYVEGLGSHCGTSAVTLAADDTITFAFTNNGDLSYNAYSGTVGNFFELACNANEVVVGFAVHTGSWMDNVNPICAPLVVSYMP